MLEILQEKNKEKIVLINAGAFYIATGKDAVLLHDILDLRCTCFKKCICKVGVPINSIEKYIEKLNKTKYAYIVYYYDKIQNKIIKKYEKEGKKNKITESNTNCLLCKGVDYYKEDEYILALNSLFKEEFKESENKQ